MLFLGGSVIALSACGGGSGTGGAPSLPAASSTATPTPGPDIQLGAGQSYSFDGSMTVTQLGLQPAPMPTATTVSTIVQNGLIKDGQTFNGVSGLYDDSVAETDTSPLKTTTSQTDAYFALSSPSPSGTTELLEYGSTWSDENGNSVTTLYSAPQILGELPEKAGASWSNSPAMTVYENDASDANGVAITSKTVYAQDGSYVQTTTYPPNYDFGNGQSQVVENNDGSGSITNAIGAGAIVFSPPQLQSNGQYLLPYAVYASPSPGPTTVPFAQGSVGAWYTVPVTLYHESDSDLGSQPIPGACNVPASVATTAMQTERSIARTDPVLGYTETETTDEYRVPTAGAVCVQMKDVQNVYYNYSGQEQFIFSPSSSATYIPTPIEITTTTETLGLGAGAAPDATRRASVIATARAHFEAHIAKLRMQRALALSKALKSFTRTHNGGPR